MLSESTILVLNQISRFSTTRAACLSTSAVRNDESKHRYRMLVVGGGSGGAAISAKYAKKFGPGHVGVLEPNTMHYYQPGFTLVGSGIKPIEKFVKPTKDVLHRWTDWIHDSAAKFDPENRKVITTEGRQIEYDMLVVAMGVQLRFDLIKGLPEAFETPGVCSNYSPHLVHLTQRAIKNFKSGNAIFSFPNTPIKCPGAPQKICYITDDLLRKQGKRENAKIFYNTSLPVIFGVKKYADALWKVANRREITVNLRHNLVEVRSDKKEVVFDVLGEDGIAIRQETFPYEMLHVGAPCSPPLALRSAIGTPLVDEKGFLRVHKHTLQHDVYKNVFGIGDCMNTPNSKTVAAVAGHVRALRMSIDAYVANRELPETYDGYASCPLLVGSKKCIMAEFNYDLQPMETFPILDQGKERRSMYYMKSLAMPKLYWDFYIKGKWEGPTLIRKFLHLGMSK